MAVTVPEFDVRHYDSTSSTVREAFEGRVTIDAARHMLVLGVAVRNTGTSAPTLDAMPNLEAVVDDSDLGVDLYQLGGGTSPGQQVATASGAVSNRDYHIHMYYALDLTGADGMSSDDVQVHLDLSGDTNLAITHMFLDAGVDATWDAILDGVSGITTVASSDTGGQDQEFVSKPAVDYGTTPGGPGIGIIISGGN